jgi:hypothetical protein
MNKIDWHYLRKPLIFFCVAVAICVALILVGTEYEEAKYEEYLQALTTLRTTHTLYRNIVNDIDLLEQYRNRYNDFKSSGLVGKERRLSWVESLESTNKVLRLPTLSYNLGPQELFARPEFKELRGVSVRSSPMDLNIGLLHEEDLFALLEGLRLSIKNLFTVDRCIINRPGSLSDTLSTKSVNLQAQCTIRWVSIDAK